VRGWARIGRGEDEAAAEEIREGLGAWNGTGAELMRPVFLSMLAEAYAAANRHGEALHILDEALAFSESTGERMYAAEVHRLRGESLLTLRPDRHGAAAALACFEEALGVAGRQGARSLELRAEASRARLQRTTPMHARG
jgi:predicted ATPase